ncbi:ornithine cyclodeaminase family protein [Xanthobacteraceae bacterium A53D]
MRMFSAADIHARLDYAELAQALKQAFAQGLVEAPVRQAYAVGLPDAPAHMLTMPAWRRGAVMGVKIVNVVPGNSARGLGAVNGLYALFDGATGAPLAVMDSDALTNRRTAAASALASLYLSRPDSHTVLVVGTGHLAAHLAAAHAAVRPIDRVLVWGRSVERTTTFVDKLKAKGLPAEARPDLAGAVAEADIVTLATTSTAPLIRGADVRPGTHVDLVGAFTPAMRESDDDLIARAAIYVDTRAGALKEAGDLLQPMASGAWAAERLRGDLHDLCAGTVAGRADGQEITLFKSVGTALEDLVAAELVASGA